MANDKTISIVGLGYVGLPLAILCEEKKYKVFGITKTPKSALTINSKKISFLDKNLVKKFNKSKFSADDKFSKVTESNIIVICVPTPVKNKQTPDLSALTSAVKNIGKNLRKGQLVILESTVNPGISEELVIPLLEKESGLVHIQDFLYAHCPERINPGDNKWNVENIPRVIGAADEKSLQQAFKFYKSIISAPIKKMTSLKEAEAVKIVENSFRDVNIAFVNELAKSFALLDIDILNVLEGASTKPFAFMAHYPGIGVGGHCIPVDPYYLIGSMKKRGFSHEFLSMARKVNKSMVPYTITLLERTLNSAGYKMQELRVGILGIAYKPNISDTRESPAFDLIKELKRKHVKIETFDPHVSTHSTVQTIEELMKKSDAIILVTAHNKFMNLLPSEMEKHNIKVFIDGRNALDKKAFGKSKVIYKGIGR